MSYENAPATKLLATHCACCARPLVDALSVELGIGPDCRKKHGFTKREGDTNWTATVAAAAGCPTAFAVVASRLEDGTEGLTDNDAREMANRIVHRVALRDWSDVELTACLQTLYALGFHKLSAKLRSTCTAVQVRAHAGCLIVKSPYSPAFNEATRGLPGRYFDREEKAWRFTTAARAGLWAALVASYPGAMCAGPDRVAVLRPAKAA
jgi:hypothetical protein